MPSHHQFPVPSEINAPDDRGGHRRLVPARIPREADDLLPADGKLVRVDKFHSGVVVGVIDTGVVVGDDGPHEFLEGRILYDGPGDLDVADPAGLLDFWGHGSFVAGIILNEAPSVSVRVKGALDKSTGKWEDEAVALAIDQLREEGVDLINLSFSGDPGESATPDVIKDALERLRGRDTVVVAAGGNATKDDEGHYLPTDAGFPAAIKLDDPLVIAVGAAERPATRSEPPAIADFSCQGKNTEAYANGRRVIGPFRDEGVGQWSGTSFACATITGRIAAAMVEDSILRQGRSRQSDPRRPQTDR